MPRAFITGITGQDGRHLSQFLAGKEGYQVFGLVHGQANPKIDLVRNENPSIEPALRPTMPCSVGPRRLSPSLNEWHVRQELLNATLPSLSSSCAATDGIAASTVRALTIAARVRSQKRSSRSAAR